MTVITPASQPFVVAAAQAAPVFLDLGRTLEKAADLMSEASRAGAKLIVFPEAFVPAYPDWVWAVPAGEQKTHDPLYAELLANAVSVPGPALDQLCRAARQCGIFAAIGINERNVEASGASLYNTLVYIDAQGRLLGKHRKLVPTGGERLVWAQGDGSTLGVYDTALGRMGGLICWENYMPLARYALYAWGIQLYLAPTWDRGDAWLATLRHIAREGRVYVISCGMALRRADLPAHYPELLKFYADAGEWINVGDSAIVDPEGEFVAGPLREKEAILYAEVDPARARGSHRMLDVAGHYARPDVFDFGVRRGERPVLREAGPTGGAGEAPGE